MTRQMNFVYTIFLVVLVWLLAGCSIGVGASGGQQKEAMEESSGPKTVSCDSFTLGKVASCVPPDSNASADSIIICKATSRAQLGHTPTECWYKSNPSESAIY